MSNDCLTQSLINPSHQIAIGNVPNEQIQAIGHLVEMAVSQMMGRHRKKRTRRGNHMKSHLMVGAALTAV